MGKKTDSQKIIEWLQARPLIKINALEEMAGIPVSVLRNAKDGKRPLPEKYVGNLQAILIRYGYK